MGRSHRDPDDLRDELGLNSAGGSSASSSAAPLSNPEHADQTAVAPPFGTAGDGAAGGVAGQIDALFTLVQDAGFTIQPGGYRVDFDEWGRPRVSLTVFPPAATGDQLTISQERAAAGDEADTAEGDTEADADADGHAEH